MAWKISLKIVFITVVIMAASVLASAEEEQDQATAEGIVALNPVLKDHHHLFTYSDPLSVRSSSYASEAVFNPRKFQIHQKYLLKYLLVMSLRFICRWHASCLHHYSYVP